MLKLKNSNIFPTDVVSRHQDVKYFPDAVGSYLPDASILLSDPDQSIFQAIQQNDLFLDPVVAFGEWTEMLLFDWGLWGDEYTPIPKAGVLHLLGCRIIRRRRRS